MLASPCSRRLLPMLQTVAMFEESPGRYYPCWVEEANVGWARTDEAVPCCVLLFTWAWQVCLVLALFVFVSHLASLRLTLLDMSSFAYFSLRFVAQARTADLEGACRSRMACLFFVSPA